VSAPIRQISLWQAPVFVVNSRLGFSPAAGSSSRSYSFHQLRPSFSRSYGCILPSSLTRVFPRTLGFSPRLPVSVLVRVQFASLEAFLGSVVRPDSLPPVGVGYLSVLGSQQGDLPPCQPTAFDAFFHSRARVPCCVTPSSNGSLQYRNFCLLSIAYALCLGLGPDLPWVDERCPGSLRLSVDPILTDLFATHTGILTSLRSTCPSGHASTPRERSPTHVLAHDAASVLYLSPGYFRRRASRPVSYYALFEWWLLLSQHPGCL
jgi:hypothetical protein